MPRFEIVLALGMTVLAVLFTCFLVDTWGTGPPSRSNVAAFAALVAGGFMWGMVICTWVEVTRRL